MIIDNMIHDAQRLCAAKNADIRCFHADLRLSSCQDACACHGHRTDLALKAIPARNEGRAGRGPGEGGFESGSQGDALPHRLRLDSGSFPPGTQVVKPEIHTVFLGFPTFFPKKNLSPPALADGAKLPRNSAPPLAAFFAGISVRDKKGRPPAGVGEHLPLSQHFT